MHLRAGQQLARAHCWFWRSLWLHTAISLGRGRACIGAPSHASACTLWGALRPHAPGIWCTTHTAADVQPAMSSAPRVHQSCPVGQLAGPRDNTAGCASVLPCWSGFQAAALPVGDGAGLSWDFAVMLGFCAGMRAAIEASQLGMLAAARRSSPVWSAIFLPSVVALALTACFEVCSCSIDRLRFYVLSLEAPARA